MGLNGAAATLGAQGINNGTTLGWKNVKGTSTRVTVNVATAGVATVNLWMREDGTRVDKILLTKSTTTPTALGPAALACSEAPPTPPTAPTNLIANDGVSQAALS